MRAFVQRPLAFIIFSFSATGTVLAQAPEQTEEITVRGRKTLGEYRLEPTGPQVNSDISTGVAQADGKTGAADALAKFEQEWIRLLSEDRQFYRAVVKYVELEDESDQARGVVDRTQQPLQVPVAAVTAAQPSGPQCEASMLTDYFQQGDVARVSGRISLAACPAGTTGSYNVAARIRDESGEIKLLEFSETWQRDDAEDVAFNTDYPIGEDELVSVRMRGLKCTCAEPRNSERAT